MRILTTGIMSGMGRFIHENLGGKGITRETSSEDIELLKKEGVDIIIHCAFNSEKDVNSKTLFHYFNDNVLLTNELVSIPHEKFIFFSTVDLYSKDGMMNMEDDIIYLDHVSGIYAETKLISESIIKERCANHLILRPTTMVGEYSRKNTLLRIIDGGGEKLFLSGDSQFNYVLYDDVLDFIKLAIDKDISGVYNVASSENIQLSEVAGLIGRKVSFGSHKYSVGNISNNKISSICPVFSRTSKDFLNQFVGECASA